MVGIPEIGGALSGLKAAMDIARGLNATAGNVAINDAKIALQSAILEAQNALLQSQEAQAKNSKRIDELEAQIAKMDRWEQEKLRYQLEEFPTGAYAYVLKTDFAAGEPCHKICPVCYQEGRKSILQTVRRHGGGEKVECPRCKIDLKTSEFPMPKVERGTYGY